jgi:DNA-directed RNA polymerase subunit RPC12/RpoP
MVEVTVYDCPECGTELEKPKDPDVRATMAFY